MLTEEFLVSLLVFVEGGSDKHSVLGVSLCLEVTPVITLKKRNISLRFQH